jgi:Uma2 family endonuclease
MSAVAAPPPASTPSTYGRDASIAKFSVRRYQEMIRQGILDANDHVELLEGYVVQKMARNPKHDAVINQINYLLIRKLPPSWNVRSQSALVFRDSQPEPDFSIVRGQPKEYSVFHPKSSDAALVLEVADSSLDRDRHDKARIYASAGIPVYWIVNLVDQRIEVYSSPIGTEYTRTEHFATGQSVPLTLDGETVASLPVSDIID